MMVAVRNIYKQQVKLEKVAVTIVLLFLLSLFPCAQTMAVTMALEQGFKTVLSAHGICCVFDCSLSLLPGLDPVTTFSCQSVPAC